MIRFGTLGTARITPRALVMPCIDEPGANIVAIAARSKDRAIAFAAHHNIPRVYNDYSEVIADPNVNAIYNPLPISLHRDWSIRALEANKHVLCEKSIACNEAEARQMADVAKQTGMVLMDAYHYRYHPVFKRAKDIYASGELGNIQSIEANFHVPGSPAENDIRMTYAMGGGVTMDIGCYPISWVRHLTNEEPEVLSVEVEVGPPNVDLYLRAKMMIAGGTTIFTSGDMRRGGRFRADVIVTGDKGLMHVNNPLLPQIGHQIIVDINGNKRREAFDRRATYGYQLDAFLDAVNNNADLATNGEDAVRQMRVIDACYRAADLPLRGQ